MAKKNSSLGKLIAFTTTVAAIGGACYIFRDQIKESEAFKKATDKLSALRNKVSDKFSSDEDDFFFDDEFEEDFEDDIFDKESKSNREYTSITINAKDNSTSDSAEEVPDDAEPTNKIIDNMKDVAENIVENAAEDAENMSDVAKDVANDVANAVKEKTEAAKDEVKEIFADDSIPTISFGSNKTEDTDESAATEEVLGYENEGLSDVYEDPDVLGDQDKLDF